MAGEEGIINLTTIELKLLTRFVNAPGRVFTRSIPMDIIWDQSYYGVQRTVDTHVSRLRAQLGRFGQLIKMVHGVGYRLKELS